MNEENKQGGAMLLELILAIAVFVIGSASIAHLYIGAQLSSLYSADKTQAIFLAKEGIEKTRTIRNSGFEYLEEGVTVEIINLDGKDFEREVAVSCFPDFCSVASLVEWVSSNREEGIFFTEHLTPWTGSVYQGGEDPPEEPVE